MITDEQAGQAREQIAFFLTDCKATLRELLPRMESHIDWDFFDGQTFRELMEAWEEFDAVWNENWPHYQARIFETSKRALEEAGLFSKQLIAKINIYKRLKEKALGQIEKSKPHFKRIFAALIAAINNALQSIQAATGIGEALREIKDLMQNMMA